MKLIFEQGAEGHCLHLLPACAVPEYTLSAERTAPLHLPHVSENELTRHYTALCRQIYGVNDGFYPLGSCTMKYNPKIDEEMASLPGFTKLHPLQPEETAQGALEALHILGTELGEVFGMDAVTFQPAAGAHGEFTGVLLLTAYHPARGDTARPKLRARNKSRDGSHVRLSGREYRLQRQGRRRSRRAACRCRPRYRRPDAHEPEYRRPV